MENDISKMIKLFNDNFSNKDILVTYTYNQDNTPKSIEEVSKDIKSNIRLIKEYRNKNMLPKLRYIAFIKSKEGLENTIYRYYMILSGDTDRKVLESLWEKGMCNTHRLQGDEFGFEGLARYIFMGSRTWIYKHN